MPDTFKTFSDFASQLRITKDDISPGSGWVREPVARTFVIQAGSFWSREYPLLWWKPCGTLNLQALQKKLQRWLQTRGLPSCDKMVNIHLGMIAVRIEDGLDLVTIMREFADCLRAVEVMKIHVMPSVAGCNWSGNLEWEGFRFGSLNASTIVSKCKDAHAFLLEDEAQKLDGADCIECPTTKHTIIDWSVICWRERSDAIKRFGPLLLDLYHQECGEAFFDEMWSDLEDAWLIPKALGFPGFDLQQLRRTQGGYSWTIITGLGPKAELSWVGNMITQDEPRQLELAAAEQYVRQLTKRNRVSEAKMSSLFPLIRSVSRSLVRSFSHKLGGRVDESFLFLVIAAEQVFSERLNTTKAIVSRTAVATYRALNIDYSAAEKLITGLYDARSRLVHDGLSVKAEMLLSAEDVGKSVLNCLLRLSHRTGDTPALTHQIWLKHLDYLIAGIAAGKPPSDADLIENGIIDSPTP